MFDRVFDFCFIARFGGSGSLLCHSSLSRFGVDWHGHRMLCDKCWRMKLSESELIARKSEFAVPTARELAWDLSREETPFAGVLNSLPKQVPLHRFRLFKRPFLCIGVQSVNQAFDLRIHEDSQSLIGSERWCVLSFE